MGKTKQKVVVISSSVRQERAEFCTNYLKTFAKATRAWADLAVILVEVDDEELFLEVGQKTWDAWARHAAPACYRLCYVIKARYKALTSAGLSFEDLKRIPPETAQWASRAKNISPAELCKPEVIEALTLPRQKAVAVLREALPDQHIEDIRKVTCKFAVSADRVIQEGYEVFKKHKDSKASFEEFVEFVVSEWILSFAEAVK